MALAALGRAASGGSVLDRIANPPQVNLLADYGAAAKTAGDIYAVRALQGQQAWGNALMQSTDPATGVVDYGKAQRLAAQAGPEAAFYATTALPTTSRLSTEQINRAGALYNTYAQASATVYSNPKDANVNAAFDSLAPFLPKDQLEAERQRVLSMSEPERQNYAQQHLFAGLSALDNLGRQAGGVTMQPYGGVSRPTFTTQPMLGRPGGVAVGEPVTHGMSAEQLNTTIVTPDTRRTVNGQPNPNYGRDFRGTLGEWLNTQPGAVPAAGGPPPPNAQRPDLNVGPGRVPPAIAGPNGQPPPPPAAVPAPVPAPAQPQPQATPAPVQPPKPAAPAAPQQPPGPTGTPLLTTSEGGLITKSGDRFQAETDRDQQAQEQQAILGNMQADLAGFVPGEGTEGATRFQNALQRWTPRLAAAFGVDPKTIASAEDFIKLSNQLLTAQGAGSDARMAIAQLASPSAHLSAQGVDMIMRQLQGNADYLRARATLARQFPNRTDYDAFQSSISDLDPRVFQIARMTTAERNDYGSKLDADTSKLLQSRAQWAREHGLLR